LILYAATTNPGKLAEFATSASAEGIDVLALPHLATLPEPIEDAPTFMGNAEIKALAYSLAAPGLLVFADDSGLEVDALGGEPGVRSARFADDVERKGLANAEEGTPPFRQERERMGHPIPSHAPTKDERNNACLASLLEALPAAPRTARFVCALALARDGEILLRAEGKVEGEMLPVPRGDKGFGYDPLFLLPALGLTMAELSADEKWQVSHRGDAFRNLLAQLGGSEIQAS
jgi:XTP/dITP diphosphohydrolase